MGNSILKFQIILPNGTVTLELIGKVKAIGKTTEELRKELMGRYASELKNPEMVVIVRSL
jgi:protein involved in polysaccharide export with SLBB domain